MFTIDELLQPNSLQEAAVMMENFPDVVVLGGCGFLKLGSRRIKRALDLSRCGLDRIEDCGDRFRIGAMATLYDIEKNLPLNGLFNGVLPRAAGNVLGVQFRHCATIGASVYSKYGFSDVLPPLLTLDTEVEFLRQGRLSLPDYLDTTVNRDILTWIHIKKDNRRASYQYMRNASADFPILNVAVSCLNSTWTLVIGARPGKARFALEASRRLTEMKGEFPDVASVAQTASQEIPFGTDSKGSADYRRALCHVLVRRAIEEVLSCK